MSMPILEGADIVCFSNDWDGDPLSKTHLMRLAARNNRVLWVNSIGNRAPKATSRDLKRIGRKLMQAFGGLREVEKNIHVLSPLALLGAFGASQVAAAVPGPNGASPRDGALVVALVALGLPWVAAAAAVAVKAVLAWLPALALGGLSLIVHRRQTRALAVAA